MSELDPRLGIRPTVETAPARNAAEVFQNDTLRPVLKLQHQQLVQLFEHYAAKRKFRPAKVAPDQRRDKIKELLTRDNRLRGLLFGAVIGQFTSEELTTYCDAESETNRRLTGLLTERILSHYE